MQQTSPGHLDGLAVATGPILQLRGVSKTITLHILKGKVVRPIVDVWFDVAPGEIVALVGASGAGKSSVVKTIHRTYLPTAGQILYHTAAGETVDLATAPDRKVLELRRREIGFVSQFLKVEPRVPALDVVAMPLRRRGVAAEDARERAASWLRELDVPEDLWSSYPSLFSGGEQQRINVARALVSQPRLLLADEPTSALDTLNTGRVVAALDRARREGTAVVGIFHDPGVIGRLADQVVRLENGRVVATGRVGEIEIPVEE